ELAKDGKWRQAAGAYYFESYTGMDMDRVFEKFDRARMMARDIYGDDPLFSLRRVYHEFTLLEDLLQGREPPAHREWLAARNRG
ncbi:MAG TPA: hypothetical protein PLG18_10245, partial [Syntrophales bacterium]|nr:hypothetical protein [Syntrophales bacterium]